MSLFSQSFILADVAPPTGSTSNFNYCIKISNLKKYPDRLFFARIAAQNSDRSATPYRLIKPDRCLEMSGYRPVASIATIAKHKVRSKDLKTTDADTILSNTKLQKMLVVTSEDNSIYRPYSLPSINEGRKIEGIYEIKSIDKSGLQLTQVRDSSMSNLIIFPIVGASILGWILWQRRQKSA